MIICNNCKSDEIVVAVWMFANSAQLDGGEKIDEIDSKCWECGSIDLDYKE